MGAAELAEERATDGYGDEGQETGSGKRQLPEDRGRSWEGDARDAPEQAGDEGEDGRGAGEPGADVGRIPKLEEAWELIGVDPAVDLEEGVVVGSRCSDEAREEGEDDLGRREVRGGPFSGEEGEGQVQDEGRAEDLLPSEAEAVGRCGSGDVLGMDDGRVVEGHG